MAEEVGHRVRNGSQATLNWPVILFLVAQTGAGIWWASGITRTLDFITVNYAADYARVEAEIRELKDDNKTKDLQIQKINLDMSHLTDQINGGWRPLDRK